MLTKKQLKIFEPFTRNIFKEYSYKGLKELSKEKSSNAFQLAVKKFKEEQLITEKKIGTSRLYTLNLRNNLVFYYIAIINEEKLPKQIKKAIDLIRQEVEKFTLFYSIVIFGSYASGEERKDSDLDIAIFIEGDNEKRKIEAALTSAELKSLIKLDIHVISQTEFLEMLKADEENLGKEIARKHLAVHNNQLFYKILNKGVKSGFAV